MPFSSELLSVPQAHLLSFFFASTYVGSLYVSEKTRLAFSKEPPSHLREKEPHERWRDDDDVIRSRLVACTIATAVCISTVLWVNWSLVGEMGVAVKVTSQRLGIVIHSTSTSLTSHLITPLLFLGPLYAMYLSSALPYMHRWSFHFDVVVKFFSWQGIRNYVSAPITEELVFRACILSIYDLAGASKRNMIIFAPLLFGIAHAHHAWETFNNYGRTYHAAKIAIQTSLIQQAYTTLFGMYCGYLFLRTGSIFPPISAHAFCNVMGLPNVTQEMRMFPSRKHLILIVYIIGVCLFVNRLETWTRTEDGTYWR